MIHSCIENLSHPAPKDWDCGNGACGYNKVLICKPCGLLRAKALVAEQAADATVFPSRLPIYVGLSDIAEGTRVDCRRCPIARATKRSLKGIVQVLASYGGVQIEMADAIAVYRIPDGAKQFMLQFDRTPRGPLAPASFILTLSKADSEAVGI